jgi:hypothetical protein
MRKKEHKVGDIVYLRGIKGKVTAVDPASGKATVHAATSGNLLGSAPAFPDITRVSGKGFKWPENTHPERETFAIESELYAGKDFNTDAVPVEGDIMRGREESAYKTYKEDYWKAVESEDSGEVEFLKKAICFQAVVIGADTELALNGKCGIDGCAYPSKGGFGPDHFALSTCRSGGHNHCTCDSCF